MNWENELKRAVAQWKEDQLQAEVQIRRESEIQTMMVHQRISVVSVKDMILVKPRPIHYICCRCRYKGYGEMPGFCKNCRSYLRYERSNHVASAVSVHTRRPSK